MIYVLYLLGMGNMALTLICVAQSDWMTFPEIDKKQCALAIVFWPLTVIYVVIRSFIPEKGDLI